MSYLVFARKFRPQSFDEVTGQEHISRTLKNAISEKRIAHAYLFSGPRGCGKTTMARIFAKALNCKSGPTIYPCGICDNCIEISKSASVDVLEIDGASNNGIDEIRTLRENVKFASANSNYKIYIIDEAHQITAQAFNALLKTLEEPPAHVVFIMATTEQHKIPVTILSRCQQYRFKLISSSNIASLIVKISKKEGFDIDSDALNIITSASGGSMRDALSLLDQAVSSSDTGKITGGYMRGLLGLLPKDMVSFTAESIAKGDMQAVLKTVEEVMEEGYNILQFARDLRDYLRQLMIYFINPQTAEVSDDDRKLFEVQKNLFSVPRHIRMNNLLSKALEEMRWHDHPRIVLEMYLLKMCEPYYNVEELISKINKLEKDIRNGSFSDENRLLEVKIDNASVACETDHLTVVWKEIADEMIKKHPLTANSLKKASIKTADDNLIQLGVSGQFDYEVVMEFREQIVKLFQLKTGLKDIKLNVVIEKEDASLMKQHTKNGAPAEKHHIISGPQLESSSLKNTMQTDIPEHIQKIANKFNSIAKKVTGGK
ncbi:MAG: DNA polymerase III subunit gamma/tau [Endomicrobium sp.]|jgi:DNA polymerase-3 subunit gamma/tau|nr:DNA polymerase III subunit gamma/tau [Endomicrobium sp.]